MLDDACPKCHGTGEQPDGWTLEQARKEPKIFHIKRLEAEYGPGHSKREVKSKLFVGEKPVY